MIKTKEVNEIRTETDVIICDACKKEIKKCRRLLNAIVIYFFVRF